MLIQPETNHNDWLLWVVHNGKNIQQQTWQRITTHNLMCDIWEAQTYKKYMSIRTMQSNKMLGLNHKMNYIIILIKVHQYKETKLYPDYRNNHWWVCPLYLGQSFYFFWFTNFCNQNLRWVVEKKKNLEPYQIQTLKRTTTPQERWTVCTKRNALRTEWNALGTKRNVLGTERNILGMERFAFLYALASFSISPYIRISSHG